MPVIDNYHQFSALPDVPFNQLQPADLLIKKIFPETAKHAVEKIITGAQRTLKADEVVKVDNGWFRKKEKIVFKNLGSSTSEHAALVIDHGNMAEAVGEGVIIATLQSRAHERYIVYRCNDPRLRAAVVHVATNLATNRPGSKGGKYSLFGAAISSFRDPHAQRNTLLNRVFSTPTEKFLRGVLAYVNGESNTRPNMFCSEFAVTAYEAAALMLDGKSAFGSSPRAMSPMEMENMLNYRPDLMQLVGHVESPIDIVYEAVKEATEGYGKSLKGFTGFFRRPSPESLQAMQVLTGLLEMGPTDYLFSTVEHYAGVVSKVPYDPSYRMHLITPALGRESRFGKLLREKLLPTNFFYL